MTVSGLYPLSGIINTENNTLETGAVYILFFSEFAKGANLLDFFA
jgi:hypothetical protein